MSNNNGASSPAPAPQLEDLNRHGRKIEELVDKIQALPDPAARAMLQDCLESVLSFYGGGLSRILQILERSGEEGRKVREALLADAGVSGLLLIHGLHPVDLETRLKGALEKVRPYMQSHGGDVQLLSLENEFARLRLEGHCKTCPSSTVTLELAVRNAIEEACPDLAGFEVEGVVQDAAHQNGNFQHVPNTAPAWSRIDLPPVRENELATVHIGNEPLIACRVGEQLYTYYDRCPGCNMPLHMGKLEREVLTCHLGHKFDVQRAGAGLDGNDLHLDPVPLLVQNGEVKVALTHPPAVEPVRP